MKSIPVILLFILCSCTLFAQYQQSTLMVGGTGGLNITSTGNNSVFSVGLNPSIGVFIADQAALGGILRFTVATSDGSTATNFGIGPFVRYYLDDAESTDRPFFLTANLGYENASISGDFFDSSDGGLFAGGGVGLSFFVTDSVAIDGILGVNYSGLADATTVGVNFGFQVFLSK